ncbi:MAG TPA: bifunctional 4-hydroxy-2-oxoglutarate aldolase/2-dehydro-3-deoxy-phosphogluconate aldolase [Blastocatellia bacterium]|nr:bifunctional 4-hydroxy-2-oxoglutarate aldolase/2-dehydro-3-deoxy-phosphogluconate aldolase [Blastocatellia bacterium]
MNQTLKQIETGKIVAILRGDFGGREEELVAAMVEGGLTAVEVTLNSRDVFDAINRLAKRFGSEIAVGAGTVLTPNEVVRAADAGAQFIVSPNRDVAVIEQTKKLGLVSLPGCFTPSEVVEAINAGADAAKLFPANSLGPAFVKALRGPLPNIRTVPTGGVTAELARDYFAAGAWAIGAGSELIGKDWFADGGLERLRERTAAFVAAGRKND